MDTQLAVVLTATLDHVSGADWEPVGKTIDRQNHDKPPQGDAFRH
jgi:hypothetical protein